MSAQETSHKALLAEAVAAGVLRFFMGRSGFDDWWSSIAEVDQKELVHSLRKTIEGIIS